MHCLSSFILVVSSLCISRPAHNLQHARTSSDLCCLLRTVFTVTTHCQDPSLPPAGSVELALQQRAKLTHTEPTLRGMAVATQTLARRLRKALAAADLARKASLVTAVLRQRADGVNSSSSGSRAQRPRSGALSSTDNGGMQWN